MWFRIKFIVATLALAFSVATGASALQQRPYDATARTLIDDGSGNLIFGAKTTYRYSGIAFTPVATPTDFIVISGSATKTCRIKRIALSGVATSQGHIPLQLIKRTTAGTLGSAVLTAITAAKHDTNDAAPTCSVSTVGTANYTTLGTTQGVLAARRLNLPAASGGTFYSPTEFEFSTRMDAPVFLRGAAELIGINGNGGALPAGTVIDYEIEIEEDNS
jgi:hypothetical protein